MSSSSRPGTAPGRKDAGKVIRDQDQDKKHGKSKQKHSKGEPERDEVLESLGVVVAKKSKAEIEREKAKRPCEVRIDFRCVFAFIAFLLHCIASHLFASQFFL
jgi:hypothetical protein